MANFQRFFRIALLIICTTVAVSASAGRDGPGGTGGGDLTSSDLLDFSKYGKMIEISPENIRGYHEAAEPALKRLEYFIPGFAQDLKKAMRSKNWLIDPRGLPKPKDDRSSGSGVLLVGRMAYQNEREIQIDGKLLKSKMIPNAIWGKLIVHEAVRAFSMGLAEPMTEEKLREVVRLIYAPKMDDHALLAEIASSRNSIYDNAYITRSDQMASLEMAQEVEKRFCSEGDSSRRPLPPLNKSDADSFDKYSQQFCARKRQQIERLVHLRDDEPAIAILDRVIQKVRAQKIKGSEKK